MPFQKISTLWIDFKLQNCRKNTVATVSMWDQSDYHILLGAVHKLRRQDFGFFLTIDIFYFMNIDENSTFLNYLPPFSCKHSLWTTPLECQTDVFEVEPTVNQRELVVKITPNQIPHPRDHPKKTFDPIPLSMDQSWKITRFLKRTPP